MHAYAYACDLPQSLITSLCNMGTTVVTFPGHQDVRSGVYVVVPCHTVYRLLPNI